jgi:hypothetical protein
MNSSIDAPMNQQPQISALSDTETATLQAAVGRIIPPSAQRGLPGANDPQIVADIVGSLGRYEGEIREALRLIEAAAGGALATLGEVQQMAVLTRFRAEQPALAASLGAVAARCYYRDDRVMRAIGMEVRPPYPRGYELDRGDWSLLDPVRRRGKIYRDADEGRGT